MALHGSKFAVQREPAPTNDTNLPPTVSPAQSFGPELVETASPVFLLAATEEGRRGLMFESL